MKWKPESRGAYALAAALCFALISQIVPSIGEGAAWLTAAALLFGLPFAMIGLLFLHGLSKAEAWLVALVAIGTISLVGHPFSFARALQHFTQISW